MQKPCYLRSPHLFQVPLRAVGNVISTSLAMAGPILPSVTDEEQPGPPWELHGHAGRLNQASHGNMSRQAPGVWPMRVLWFGFALTSSRTAASPFGSDTFVEVTDFQRQNPQPATRQKTAQVQTHLLYTKHQDQTLVPSEPYISLQCPANHSLPNVFFAFFFTPPKNTVVLTPFYHHKIFLHLVFILIPSPSLQWLVTEKWQASFVTQIRRIVNKTINHRQIL